MWVLRLDYRVSNTIGYAIGSCVSFILNRSWTFRHRGSWISGSIRWLSVVALAYMANLAMVILLHTRFGVPTAIAQLGGAIVYTVSSFVGGRFFAFK